MADYKVTDSELISVANAIRTKGGTQAQLEWPAGYISAIQAIPTGGVTIVPWSTGTDAEIAAMVAALDAGTLTIADTGWEIGDERIVSLSAMNATGVDETHAAQDVTLVLMDSQHYDLVGGGKDHFVVGMKDCLNEVGAMNRTDSGTIDWDNCDRRTWCNTVFRSAIPEVLRGCFKQFQCKAADNTNTIKTSSDYFSLFGEVEVVGRRMYYCPSAEEGATSELAYYNTLGNDRQKKKCNGFTNPDWFTRSVAWGYSNRFTILNNTSGSYSQVTRAYGLSMFGCI